jgi:hypothetical protein
MPDGTQFIVVQDANAPGRRLMDRDHESIVLNWFTELQQRVPVK